MPTVVIGKDDEACLGQGLGEPLVAAAMLGHTVRNVHYRAHFLRLGRFPTDDVQPGPISSRVGDEGLSHSSSIVSLRWRRMQQQQRLVPFFKGTGVDPGRMP